MAPSAANGGAFVPSTQVAPHKVAPTLAAPPRTASLGTAPLVLHELPYSSPRAESPSLPPSPSYATEGIGELGKEVVKGVF